MASGTIKYSALMTPHQEIYNGRSAKRWNMSVSGAAFPSSPYKVTRAVIKYDIRNVYASDRHMVVSRVDNGTETKLGDVPTGSKGKHTENLSTSADYANIKTIELDGVERWACQLRGDSYVEIEVTWEEVSPAVTEPPKPSGTAVITGKLVGVSSKDHAVATDIAVAFDGVDISDDVSRYMLSMTYTDNEEDEADDLQLKLQDRDGLWLRVSRETSKTEPIIVEKIVEVEKVVEVPVEQKLKISLIEPNSSQPRKKFDEEGLQELANSIKEFGILQPLLVQQKDDHYEIIAGERRWRAAKLAGLVEIPVLIREYDKQRTMEIALIENVQRADLNPIEEAMAYQRLIQEFELTQEEIANRVSKNRATITNSMRLLKLDQRVQQFLVDGQISSGHARALLGLDEGEKQYQAAKRIIQENLSVRDAEKLVKLLNRPEKEKKQPENGPDINLIYRQIEDKLKTIMGTKVIINRKDKNKGRIEIEYYSQEELERLIELMESMHS